MNKETFKRSGRSAAAPTKITYSAQELAELYLTTREDFIGLDMEEVTNGWNLNYIFDFLYYIRNVDLYDDIIEWIALCWQTKHQYYNSYDKVSDNTLELNFINFKAQLQFIKAKLFERFKSEKHTEELRAKMLAGYRRNTINTTPKQVEVVPDIVTSTNPPVFPQKAAPNNDYHVDIASLPESIRMKVLISQQVFDVFVRQLNDDIWLTVTKDKTKLCGCLFFLCNFHHITSRNTEPEEFDLLLHHVVFALNGKGSIVSSIRRREETKKSNIERSYKCYACADVNKNMEHEIYKLRNDCKLLIDGFSPILEAMDAEERAAKGTDNQQVSASSAA